MVANFWKLFAENLPNSLLKLVHKRVVLQFADVNKQFLRSENPLYLLGEKGCSQGVHRRFFVNKLCISNHCRMRVSRYDVTSSLKELRWKAAVNRLKPKVSRIIPGNWGKAGSGWLARLLLSRIARFGSGGRIHQFL